MINSLSVSRLDPEINQKSRAAFRAVAQVAATTPEQRQDPRMRAMLNNISDGVAKSMVGLLHTFVLEGMPDDWLLLRASIVTCAMTGSLIFCFSKYSKIARNR